MYGVNVLCTLLAEPRLSSASPLKKIRPYNNVVKHLNFLRHINAFSRYVMKIHAYLVNSTETKFTTAKYATMHIVQRKYYVQDFQKILNRSLQNF